MAMNTVRRSLALSALDSYLALALQLASTVAITRLLTPEQIGVFAVAAVFAALASTFRDFGVAEYLIQEREFDNDTIRAALTVNIVISWTMAVLLLVLAPVAAAFYRHPGVAEVMRVQAANFLLIPFGAVTMAWFRREMNFKPIFVAGLLANTASFVVSVTLALRGFGYMSLSWSSLAGVVVTVLASIWMRPGNFPRWPGLRKVGQVVQFGKCASGIYIFGQAGKGAPEMIIGRVQDMAMVGTFSRAYGLAELFNRLVLCSIMPVCLPYFAQSVREQGTPLRGMLNAMAFLTATGWPFLLFMAVATFPAIRIVYGVQWVDSVPLARLLCAVAAVELLYYPAKEAMLALGLASQSNQLQMLTQGLRVLGLLAAVPCGLAGACWGLLAAAVLGALLSHRYLAAYTGLRWSDTLASTKRSATVALIAAAPVALQALAMPIDESNYARVGITGGLAGAVLWLVALRLLRHPLWLEVERSAAALWVRCGHKRTAGG